jgi:hypothetical protein
LGAAKMMRQFGSCRQCGTADQDLKANHPAVMASVASVTGIPVIA